MKKVLVISAHTDDVELGCGAVIYQLIHRKAKPFEVYSMVFNTSNYYPGAEKLLVEWHKSMDVLGILDHRRFTFDYPVRRFPEYRQEILDRLIEYRSIIDPDYILSPNPRDLHQDHGIVGFEALRAFNNKILWNYEQVSWGEMPAPQIFVPVSGEDLDFKVRALQQYKSQYDLKRPYFSEKVIRGMAAMRGIQSGVEWAEAFTIQRMVYTFNER